MSPLSTTRARARLGPISRLLPLLLLLAVIAAACGGGGDDEATEDATPSPEATEEPTATAEPTEVPTATPVEFDFDLTSPRSPLNGMPIDEPSTTRLLTVKIDNHPNARPQSGIQHADMMIEIYVEGITRFLSVWQDSDAETLGPIRSMRPTDFAIQNSWSSLFVNSGGQGWVQAIGNASNVQWRQEPPGTFRIGSRSAPHNLYGNTESLRELNNRGDYDEPLDPLWTFGVMPDDADEATEIVNTWPQNHTTQWSWNGSEYEKSTSGVPHTYLDDDLEEQRLTADTLVMLEMDITTQSGGAGTTAVPVSRTTGSGVAWVFADGKVISGTWERESDTEWFTFTADDGGDLVVPPGRLWLVLARTGGVSFS